MWTQPWERLCPRPFGAVTVGVIGECALVVFLLRSWKQIRWIQNWHIYRLVQGQDAALNEPWINCMLGIRWTALMFDLYLPVVPGQAGGGSFQKEKNYIAQKEFAYRMCARRPTSAMPKSFLCCEQAFCRSMVVMFCALKWSVLMSWCLLRGQVMWWSRHLMRCDGLFCVMSRDAMRCHGDELYYSSITLYYKVLLQYYPVLQSTTPVLFCTTKYYSNTTTILLRTTNAAATLYYKVLLQYYSVLQILLCTRKYYSSTTLYCKVLLQY